MKKIYCRLSVIFLFSAILLVVLFAAVLRQRSIRENAAYLNQLLDGAEENYRTALADYDERIRILEQDYLHRARAADLILSGIRPLISGEGLETLRGIMEVADISLIDSFGQILRSTDREEGTLYEKPEEIRSLTGSEKESVTGTEDELYVMVPSDSGQYAVLRVEAESGRTGMMDRNSLIAGTLGKATTEYGTCIAAVDGQTGEIIAFTENNEQLSEMPGTDCEERKAILESAAGKSSVIMEINGVKQNAAVRNCDGIFLTAFSSMEAIRNQTAFTFRTGILGICAVMALTIFFVRYYLNKYLFSYFEQMKEYMTRILEYGEQKELRFDTVPELAPLLAAVRELGKGFLDQAEGINRMEGELSAAQEEAKYDMLTGLYNRSGFEKLAEEFLNTQSPSGVFLLFDLDNFKRINDSEGHPEGDRVLERFAEILTACFRQSDIIGRLGGDEFVVLLTNEMQETTLTKKFDFILESVRASLGTYYGKYEASVSIGAVPVDGTIRNYDRLYRCADTALYIAKYLGKDRYYINSRKIACMKRECIGCREDCPRSRLLNLSKKEEQE